MVTFGDASLVITAWRRPEYLWRVLESWSKVPEVHELRRVVIALGWSEKQDDQLDVIKEASKLMGRAIDVRRDSSRATFSPGMHRAIGEAADAEFREDSKLEYLLLSEEDVAVSDDVLKYHAWCREKWETDLKVLVVTSHNPLGTWHTRDTSDEGVSQSNVQLYPFFNPWCWGTWRRQWTEVLEPQWDWDCNKGSHGWDSGYDWQVGRIMREQGFLSPNPDAARSTNIGFEGGVYTSRETLEKVGQSIGYRAHRDNPGYQLAEPDMRFAVLGTGDAGALGPRCKACGAVLDVSRFANTDEEFTYCPACGVGPQ